MSACLCLYVYVCVSVCMPMSLCASVYICMRVCVCYRGFVVCMRVYICVLNRRRGGVCDRGAVVGLTGCVCVGG